RDSMNSSITGRPPRSRWALTVAFGAVGLALAFNPHISWGAEAALNQKPNLVLKEQGTFYVGGSIEVRTPNSSSTVTRDPRSLPGHIAVNQMYVEYQIPASQKHLYPIVFVHGGGDTGQHFRTTPDGREGWFTSFTRRGFAVYAVDGPNRGRAGWDPTKRFAV